MCFYVHNWFFLSGLSDFVYDKMEILRLLSEFLDGAVFVVKFIVNKKLVQSVKSCGKSVKYNKEQRYSKIYFLSQV